MIWEKCSLKKQVQKMQSGVPVTDALNNPVFELQNVLETKARITPFDSSEIGLDGRTITSDSQCFAIPKKEIPACDKAVIGEIEYDIVETIKLSPRYCVLVGRLYKK